MDKVAVLIRCYKLTKMLPAVLAQYDWVDKILVMNYRFPDVENCQDDTAKICFEHNVECRVGEGLKQHEIFNHGLTALSDYSCVFIADADEFFLREDMERIVDICKDYDGVMSKVVDYITLTKSLPPRDHHPIVAVNPKKIEFTNVRCASGKLFTSEDIVMHHFGYSWKGADLDWKHQNKWYSAFHEMMAQEYVDANCPEEIKELINGNCSIT